MAEALNTQTQANDMTSFPPVYLINSDLPSFEEKVYTTVEICRAAEAVTGPRTIDGAQPKDLLWRVYPLTQQARCDLLVSGLSLRGVHIRPYDKNPLIVRHVEGEREVPTTRVLVGGIPLSFNNEAILDAIKHLPEVKVRSAIFYERGRDENKRLTPYKTGRRFLFIEVPPTPLPKKLKIGHFTATIFHWEQKQTLTCGNCLATGHSAQTCERPIKCRQCFELGHRAGAPECRLVPPGARRHPAPTLEQEEIKEIEEEATPEETPIHNTSPKPNQTRPTSLSPPPHPRPRQSSKSPPPRQPSPSTKASSAKPANSQGQKNQERGRQQLRQAQLTLDKVLQKRRTPSGTPKSRTRALEGDLIDQFERDESPRTKRRREAEAGTPSSEINNENELC